MQFLRNFLISLVTLFVSVVAVSAFNGPVANPPTGSGSFSTGTNPPANSIYIDALGNVGVGTTTPTQKLSVSGVVESKSGGFKFPDGTTQTTAVTAGVAGAGTVNYLPKFTAGSTVGNSLIFDNGTNIGIGNTTPGGKLTISAGSNTAILADANTNTGPTISAINSNATSIAISGNGGWRGVYGIGGLYGVDGESTTANGVGVYGNSTGTGGIGVKGTGVDYGVYGNGGSTGAGIYGTTASSTLAGVYGFNSTGSNYGALGYANNIGVYGSGSYGIYGANNTGAPGNGVLGQSNADSSPFIQSRFNAGVSGINTASGVGVYGESSNGGIGVEGYSISGIGASGSGAIYGIYGTTASINGVGIQGRNTSTGGVAVSGIASGGTGTGIGVYGSGHIGGSFAVGSNSDYNLQLPARDNVTRGMYIYTQVASCSVGSVQIALDTTPNYVYLCASAY